jgi:23S rRNA (uracil1939-C5)-methyltransferase
VNRHVAALAYSAIADFAATLVKVSCVWDVYAGVGTIARAVASRLPSVTSVFCVEIRATAVDDARAAWRDSSGAAFHAVAADAANAFAADLPQPDLVVLNPPRAGCDAKVLTLVAARKPLGIAYLSCNPQTLARDLALLTSSGYEISRVVPFDMLPHTPHVETLVSLRRV